MNKKILIVFSVLIFSLFLIGCKDGKAISGKSIANTMNFDAISFNFGKISINLTRYKTF